jgi:hypothetical protein
LDKLAEYEEQLDKLVERVADGDLSEELFGKLSARLERKIAALNPE